MVSIWVVSTYKDNQNVGINVRQFGCGILMVGPKKQDFCQRMDMLKGYGLKTILGWIMVYQKVPKLYFQNQFSMSKIDGIFSKINHLRIWI